MLFAILVAAACDRRGTKSRGSDVAAQLPPSLHGLRLQHPRLLASDADFDRVRAYATSSSELAAWQAKLRHDADALLNEPAAEYRLPDGKRLLAVSRKVLERAQTLALAYRLFRDRAYVTRLWTELGAVASFTDWNPSHFLDTAELTHAFAISYDWLYDQWSPAQRTTIVNAIVHLGLEPGLRAYEGLAASNTWPRVNHNWNQVCNAAMVMGALAIADEQPRLADTIVTAALHSVPTALASYEPDGATPEGPTYWDYGTGYTTLMLDSLQSALGRDDGLGQRPGLLAAADYAVHIVGPSGRPFSFADNSPDETLSPLPLWWFARHTTDMAVGKLARQLARPQPYDILFARPEDFAPIDLTAMPLDKYWRGAEVVTMRGRWNDPDATFVGFKAGTNGVNHGHLDLGTFVVEALGETWAVELGSDRYNLPDYFGRRRWNYYRLRPEGHNTLVVSPDSAGPEQAPRAHTAITRFVSEPSRAFAIADLSNAYAPGASVVRGVALRQRRDVLVEDQLHFASPTAVRWFMHTRAEIALSKDGRSAELTQNGKHFYVTVLAPEAVRFAIVEARPLPTSPDPHGQDTNAGVRKLVIEVPPVEDARIAVLLSPDRPSGAAPNVVPLEAW
jgi:hypothetical protein